MSEDRHAAVEVEPDPPAGLDWRRVHPVTPLVRGWSILAVALVLVGQRTVEGLPQGENLLGDGRWWPVLGGIVLVGLVGFAYSAVAWRMTSYAVDEESVHLRKGVLFRQQRRARLDRVQAIDVRQPLVARLVGLAELNLEVAGGAGSGVAIGFLKEADAARLRAELLARAAGVRVARRAGADATVPGLAPDASPAPPGTTGATDAHGVDAATAGAALPGAPAVGAPVGDPSGHVAGEVPLGVLEAPEAPEQPVTTVPPGRVIASLVRSGATVFLLLGVLGLVGVAVGTRSFGSVVTALPMVLGFGGYLFQRFTTEFNFRSALSPDGIRLRHGLLETRAQTIPPGRVQAIEVKQGPFWRGPDWWRVEVNVAGYGMSSDGSVHKSVLLPVGSRQEALTALWLVLPDLGTDDPVALLDAGLTGTDDEGGWTASPRRARVLDPVAWRRNGFVATERALLVRRGRVVRRLQVVPHERTQSLAVQQGPWQRRLRLASFTVHSTPGPVSPVAWHLDEHVAGLLLQEQARRARAARAQAGPEQWMRGRDA